MEEDAFLYQEMQHWLNLIYFQIVRNLVFRMPALSTSAIERNSGHILDVIFSFHVSFDLNFPSFNIFTSLQ